MKSSGSLVRPVHLDDVVEVRAGAAAGTAERGDHLAALDHLTELHAQRVVVAVLRAHAVTVVDHDAVAQRTALAHEGHAAARGRDHRRAGRAGDVEAGVELRLVRERRHAVAVARGQPALGRPDRRRRREQVGLALEALHQIGERGRLALGHDAQGLGRLAQQADAPAHVVAFRDARHARVGRQRLQVRRERILGAALAALQLHRFLGAAIDRCHLGATAGRGAGDVRDDADLALELVELRELEVDAFELLLELGHLCAALGGLLAQTGELAVVDADADVVDGHRETEEPGDAGGDHAAAHPQLRDLEAAHRRRLVGDHDQRVAVHQCPRLPRASLRAPANAKLVMTAARPRAAACRAGCDRRS